MSNYIFLDVDGILNNQNSMLFYHGNLASNYYVDPRSVALLGELCKYCNAKVVMSSSWRRGLNDDLTPRVYETKFYDGSYEDSQTVMLLNGFKEPGIEPIGKTDTEHHSDGRWDRSGQILRYVDKYLKPEDLWIVFDDEDICTEGTSRNAERVQSHFIQTDFYANGLDYEHICRAMDYFETDTLKDFDRAIMRR